MLNSSLHIAKASAVLAASMKFPELQDIPLIMPMEYIVIYLNLYYVCAVYHNRKFCVLYLSTLCQFCKISSDQI